MNLCLPVSLPEAGALARTQAQQGPTLRNCIPNLFQGSLLAVESLRGKVLTAQEAEQPWPCYLGFRSLLGLNKFQYSQSQSHAPSSL